MKNFSIQNWLADNNLSPVVSVAGNGIVKLTEGQFNQLRPRTTAQTNLSPGQHTKAHTHEKVSFYLVKRLAVQLFGKLIELPRYALVVVQPKTEHPWQALEEQGEVCDVTAEFIHEPHVVLS